jgi:pilus assembly protein Flp/PilA
LNSEDGPTAVEYAVMAAFIVVVCITAIRGIGTNVNIYFSDARDALT